ncbi:hypothetical protein GOODEAATRI_011456 [Goodea atripinnis]|uniref:peptidyl-tRNA hydrolase n=1 Tax=Goodea atripinnis TaxID=208336 RepID=A0ABV0PXX7_9TELE
MAAPGAGAPTRLVQYVVVRSDLVHKLSWPLGAVITQACHAATAAIHLHYGDPDTQRYLEELDSMHKVVLGVSVDMRSEGAKTLDKIPIIPEYEFNMNEARPVHEQPCLFVLRDWKWRRPGSRAITWLSKRVCIATATQKPTSVIHGLPRYSLMPTGLGWPTLEA